MNEMPIVLITAALFGWALVPAPLQRAGARAERLAAGCAVRADVGGIDAPASRR
ncbi:hypothetical protein [Arthrobacter sp. TMS2-4]